MCVEARNQAERGPTESRHIRDRLDMSHCHNVTMTVTSCQCHDSLTQSDSHATGTDWFVLKLLIPDPGDPDWIE